MEFNKALPPTAKHLISNAAVRQARAYIKAGPVDFSYKTSCCGAYRRNSFLFDPGYYLNGGPSCQQQSNDCTVPPKHEMKAIADSLVPGSFVFAPRSEDRGAFFPAIVDFCPTGESGFVIFKNGGPLCCSPYAYYVTFLPDFQGQVFQGWFTADLIVPVDTAVNLGTDTPYNINCPYFDSAIALMNKYYFVTLAERLLRFSLVCRSLSFGARQLLRLLSPGKLLRTMVAKQARRISAGLLKLRSGNYERYEDGEKASSGSSMASASTSSTASSGSGFTGLLRKLSTKRHSGADKTAAEEDDDFGYLSLSELAHERDHIHQEKQVSPFKERAGGAGTSTEFLNFTRHYRIAAHEVFKRSAIQAVVKCGETRIKIHKED